VNVLLVPAHPGFPGQIPQSRKTVVCVCVLLLCCLTYDGCNALSAVCSGSILEGPNPENLKPVVEQAMPMLIELLKDSSIVVRDTAAWTVGRVCEILPDAVINEHFLNPLLIAMVEGLNSEPRVAANVCWVRMLSLKTVISVSTQCSITIRLLLESF